MREDRIMDAGGMHGAIEGIARRAAAGLSDGSRGPRIVAACAALLLAFSTSAFAQEPTDYSALDTMSRFVGSTNAAVQEIGKLGGTLRDMRANDFAGMGTGSQRRGMARTINAATELWRKTGNAVKNSAPYKAAPGLFLASDVITSVVAPLSAYDLKGATAGAVNIAVSNIAGNAGTAAAGGFGAGIGMAVGSFIPGIGTAVGGIVGGAVGSVAGGYISASAYDIYVKQTVLDAVEGGLAWIFDPDPLAQAMQAREEHLRQVAAIDLLPEWEKLHMVSGDFGASGVELVSPPTIFYEPGTRETGLVQPGADLLAGLSGLQLKVWNPDYPQYPVHGDCTISGENISCTGGYAFENWRSRFNFSGQISAATAVGPFKYTLHIDYDAPCSQDYAGRYTMTYRFDANGQMTATIPSHGTSLTVNNCEGDWPSNVDAPAQTLVGVWTPL